MFVLFSWFFRVQNLASSVREEVKVRTDKVEVHHITFKSGAKEFECFIYDTPGDLEKIQEESESE